MRLTERHTVISNTQGLRKHTTQEISMEKKIIQRYTQTNKIKRIFLSQDKITIKETKHRNLQVICIKLNLFFTPAPWDHFKQTDYEQVFVSCSTFCELRQRQ